MADSKKEREDKSQSSTHAWHMNDQQQIVKLLLESKRSHQEWEDFYFAAPVINWPKDTDLTVPISLGDFLDAAYYQAYLPMSLWSMFYDNEWVESIFFRVRPERLNSLLSEKYVSLPDELKLETRDWLAFLYRDSVTNQPLEWEKLNPPLQLVKDGNPIKSPFGQYWTHADWYTNVWNLVVSRPLVQASSGLRIYINRKNPTLKVFVSDDIKETMSEWFNQIYNSSDFDNDNVDDRKISLREFLTRIRTITVANSQQWEISDYVTLPPLSTSADSGIAGPSGYWIQDNVAPAVVDFLPTDTMSLKDWDDFFYGFPVVMNIELTEAFDLSGAELVKLAKQQNALTLVQYIALWEKWYEKDRIYHHPRNWQWIDDTYQHELKTNGFIRVHLVPAAHSGYCRNDTDIITQEPFDKNDNSLVHLYQLESKEVGAFPNKGICWTPESLIAACEAEEVYEWIPSLQKFNPLVRYYHIPYPDIWISQRSYGWLKQEIQNQRFDLHVIFVPHAQETALGTVDGQNGIMSSLHGEKRKIHEAFPHAIESEYTEWFPTYLSWCFDDVVDLDLSSLFFELIHALVQWRQHENVYTGISSNRSLWLICAFSTVLDCIFRTVPLFYRQFQLFPLTVIRRVLDAHDALAFDPSAAFRLFAKHPSAARQYYNNLQFLAVQQYNQIEYSMRLQNALDHARRQTNPQLEFAANTQWLRPIWDSTQSTLGKPFRVGEDPLAYLPSKLVNEWGIYTKSKKRSALQYRILMKDFYKEYYPDQGRYDYLEDLWTKDTFILSTAQKSNAILISDDDDDDKDDETDDEDNNDEKSDYAQPVASSSSSSAAAASNNNNKRKRSVRLLL